MKYTIISIHKEKYKEHGKESLFKLIDEFGIRKFSECFSDYFYISSKQNLFKYKDFISQEKRFYIQDEIKLNLKKTLFSNAYYMILDEYKNILNISVLIDDYKRSRNVKDSKRINYVLYWKEKHSTQSYRNSIKRSGKKSSLIIKEHKNLKECEENGIKVRRRRLSLFSDIYISANYHDRVERQYEDNKTWKNKKIAKQWQK